MNGGSFMTKMEFFAFTSITIPISSHTPFFIPLTRSTFERGSLSHRLRSVSVSVHGESTGNSPTPPAPSSSSSCGEDLQALNAVSELYSSVKRKSISELSEIIGDECRCICSFLPFFRTFHEKEQLVAFFSFLTKTFGNNIEFTVRPTLQKGMSIGVAWKLEWNKKHAPFGRGFSLDLCQIYQGRITLRNVEMFLEPFLQSEPLKANVVAILMTITKKISSLVLVVLHKEVAKKRAGYLVVSLLVAAAILMLLLK